MAYGIIAFIDLSTGYKTASGILSAVLVTILYDEI